MVDLDPQPPVAPDGTAAPPRRRLPPPTVLAAGGAALAVLAAVAGWIGYQRIVAADGPLETHEQVAAPALVPTDDPRRGELELGAGAAIVAGPRVEVVVEAPPGATEMQIGFDPTFRAGDWVPVAERLELATSDVGYQMIFGRFRPDPEADTSPVTVLGVTVDPTYEAAVASRDGRHRASWVRPLTPTSIVVRVEAGRIVRGGVGEADRLVGRPLDAAALVAAEWTLGVEGGSEPAVAPTGVERITRANGTGFGLDGEPFTPLAHDVILRFDEPIEPGTTYRLRPPVDLLDPISFAFDPAATVSPAVHVNQNGYAVSDRLKVGYLAGYPTTVTGAGELYAPGMPFVVVDVTDRRAVIEGTTTSRPADEALGLGDLTGTAVYEIDFSALREAGRYQVCVVEVGCSEPFDVDDDVWLDLAVTTARAMYHQRSGVALGPPYTSVGRPRAYHPDDGVVVNESTHRLIDSPAVPAADGFAALTAARTDATVPEAWGGHFDAGDWDRRIDHLHYVRVAVELVDRHPEVFAGLDLQIPESGDAVPDLLDEGLWTLDLYRRLQRGDGAIPGGIEASEHPLAGSTSWTDTLAVQTYAPDPLASYLYAGVAAQTATVLRAYAPDRAAGYLDSALAAMAWAEDQPSESGLDETIQAHRSVAAVALYGATGEQRWHDLFVATTTLTDGVDRFLSCHEHTRCEAGWLYLGLDDAATDSDLRATIEQSFVATAEEILDAADGTALGWTLDNRLVPLVWGLGVGGAPKVTALLRAYELTGDPRYRAASERSAAVSLGANPTNTVFVTGVGRHPVRHPLIVDVAYGGLLVWPGTPVYGNHRLGVAGDDTWVEEFVLAPAGVDPLPSELPYLWQWSDTPEVPMYNEFTVFQSHGPALYAFGLLAVRP